MHLSKTGQTRANTSRRRYLLGECFDDDPFLAMLLDADEIRSRSSSPAFATWRRFWLSAECQYRTLPKCAGRRTLASRPIFREPLLLDGDTSGGLDTASPFGFCLRSEGDITERVFAFRLPPVDALPAKLRGAPTVATDLCRVHGGGRTRLSCHCRACAPPRDGRVMGPFAGPSEWPQAIR